MPTPQLVGPVDRVRLGEGHPVLCLDRVILHDRMLDEGNLAVLTDLLEPCQAPAVSVQRRDHVVIAVAVYVVGVHLGPTPLGEAEPIGPESMPR